MKTKPPLPLPPSDFTNAVNKHLPEYDFRGWQTKPEWKLWCECSRSTLENEARLIQLRASWIERP